MHIILVHAVLNTCACMKFNPLEIKKLRAFLQKHKILYPQKIVPIKHVILITVVMVLIIWYNTGHRSLVKMKMVASIILKECPQNKFCMLCKSAINIFT